MKDDKEAVVVELGKWKVGMLKGRWSGLGFWGFAVPVYIPRTYMGREKAYL